MSIIPSLPRHSPVSIIPSPPTLKSICHPLSSVPVNPSSLTLPSTRHPLSPTLPSVCHPLSPVTVIPSPSTTLQCLSSPLPPHSQVSVLPSPECLSSAIPSLLSTTLHCLSSLLPPHSRVSVIPFPSLLTTLNPSFVLIYNNKYLMENNTTLRCWDLLYQRMEVEIGG
uniref:Uncharacterized protein n=2 Tax=Cacopsylla melanoneura TaxID=428564 RepID=A0A8D8Z585_9HEMI